MDMDVTLYGGLQLDVVFDDLSLTLQLGGKGEKGDFIGVAREVEIDVGSTFVPMFTYVHTDVTVTENSIVNAFLLGKRTSDNRDPDEAFVEDIQVFVIPGAGQITFYLRPALRLFHGRFRVGYTVS